MCGLFLASQWSIPRLSIIFVIGFCLISSVCHLSPIGTTSISTSLTHKTGEEMGQQTAGHCVTSLFFYLLQYVVLQGRRQWKIYSPHLSLYHTCQSSLLFFSMWWRWMVSTGGHWTQLYWAVFSDVVLYWWLKPSFAFLLSWQWPRYLWVLCLWETQAKQPGDFI